MNSDDKNESDENLRLRAEQQLMHALLQGLHEPEELRENRISETLNRFDQSEPVVVVTTPTTRTSPPPRRRRRNLFVLAASVMLAGFFWNQLLQPTALDAAVSRVQEAAKSPVTRIYDVRVNSSRSTVVRRGRMHTRSTNLFVGEMEDKKISPMIFGTDGVDDWYVAGERSGYLDEQADRTRFQPFLEAGMYRMMVANRLLESINDDYEVTLSDVPLPTDQDRECTALVGKRIGGHRRSPAEFRVWADKKTGVALYLELRMRQSSRVLTFEYVGETTVDDDYFTLEKHRDRRTR